MPKLCKDCAHFWPAEFTMDRCVSPANGVDLVTGETKMLIAAFERDERGTCGKDGKNFEQRKTPLPAPPLPPPPRVFDPSDIFPSWIVRVFRALRGW